MTQLDISNERKARIWQEIIKIAKADLEKQEDEITLKEFMKLMEIENQFVARNRLEKLVREGKLTKRIISNPKGGRLALYKPTK